jgi:hypothetical protein
VAVTKATKAERRMKNEEGGMNWAEQGGERARRCGVVFAVTESVVFHFCILHSPF